MGFGEGVTLDATAFGCGQFDIDIVVFQAHLIVAGVGTLILMGEFGVDAQRSFRFFIRQGGGKEKSGLFNLSIWSCVKQR